MVLDILDLDPGASMGPPHRGQESANHREADVCPSLASMGPLPGRGGNLVLSGDEQKLMAKLQWGHTFGGAEIHG